MVYDLWFSTILPTVALRFKVHVLIFGIRLSVQHRCLMRSHCFDKWSDTGGSQGAVTASTKSAMQAVAVGLVAL